MIVSTSVAHAVFLSLISVLCDAGTYPPFTVDDIPRATYDYEQQNDILYKNPDVQRRGPLPIRLFPAFRSGKHMFVRDYNLGDKSESMPHPFFFFFACSLSIICWVVAVLGIA
jgi:hypothetical protein